MKPPCILHTVWAEQGEYESACDWVVAVYETRAQAEVHLELVKAEHAQRIKELREDEESDSPYGNRYYALRERPYAYDPNAGPNHYDMQGREYFLGVQFLYSDPSSMPQEHAALVDLAKQNGWMK